MYDIRHNSQAVVHNCQCQLHNSVVLLPVLASLPRMRRHCRSHSTWRHELIHALCDSSHLSSFVVRSLRCLLAYLCDGSPFADWGAAPAPQTPPKRSRPSSGTRSEQTPKVEDHNLPQSLDALLALVRSEAERASGQQAPATQGNNSAADGALPAAPSSQQPTWTVPPPPPPPTHPHTHTHTHTYE